MKKLILLALTSIALVGCMEKQPDGTYKISSGSDRIVVYDSCEYFYIANSNATVMAHKGNCRFCAERRKQELKELKELLNETGR